MARAPPPVALHLLLFLLALLAPPRTGANPYGPYWPSCSKDTNYSSGDAFQANLLQLRAALPGDAIKNRGFATLTAGAAPDAVYGLTSCLADYSWDACQGCLQVAAAGITEVCPNAKTVSAAYYGCLLRYSGVPFFGTAALGIVYYTTGYNYSDDPGGFEAVRAQLMGRLAAAAPASPLRLAYGNQTYNSTHSLYGMVQCTRDLPADECARCLKDYGGGSGYKFMRLVFTGYSCYLRHNIEPFNITVPPEAPAPAPAPVATALSGAVKREGWTKAIVIIVIIVVVLSLVIITGCYKLWRRKKRHTSLHVPISSGPRVFSYKELAAATNDFSKDLFLGNGKFGEVYKGILKNNGKTEEIAVKKLLKGCDDVGFADFKSEFDLLSGIRHHNVVLLVGYCCDGENNNLLCYELLQKNTLDAYIFGNSTDILAPLDWKMCYNIIKGICEGLQYIHELCRTIIVHRDIKPSNILLDKNMTPKIADFGLSRLFSQDKTSTRNVIGTIGYMAPEYIQHGKITTEGDVYSLGVVILETVTRQRNQSRCDSSDVDNSARKFIVHVQKIFDEGNLKNLVNDSYLGDDCVKEVSKCIKIGLMCVDTEPKARPSVRQIIELLQKDNIRRIGSIDKSKRKEEDEEMAMLI